VKKLLQLEVHSRLLARRALRHATPREQASIAAQLTCAQVASVISVICLVVPAFSQRALEQVGGGITVHTAVTQLFTPRVARAALPFVYHMLQQGRLVIVTPPVPRGMDSPEVLALRMSLHQGDAMQRLEERMGRLEVSMDERLGRLEVSMDERMGRIEERMGRVEQLLERIVKRLEEKE
jgi:hypothetical protein